ncbi:MAG TPA: nucleotidyltransferase domain-containing protein [Longimicrobiaceae bacterium]|nr:nucleotidyltransferase domain-containing protein [Longimicrobiaceae bacterium]
MPLLLSPFDRVLGSTSKIRLLRVLLPLSRPVGLREAARLAGISASSAHIAMDELTAMAIFDRQQATGQHLYWVNHENYVVMALSNLFAAETERWRKLVLALQEVLKSVPGVEAAAIYGSSARGEDRPDSDLDLLVVTRSADADEAVWDRLLDEHKPLQEKFGVRVSPVVLDLERLREQAADGDPFIREVIRDGITVVKPSIEQLLR